MSLQPPLDEDGKNSTSPVPAQSRLTVRPSANLRLPANHCRLKLFRILKKAWKHLIAELCPSQPKSVCKKARDVLRNVPHWQRYVGELRMSPTGAVDLTQETDACSAVLEAARLTVERLVDLVEANVRDHPRAQSEWVVLTAALDWAVRHVGGEFTEAAAVTSDEKNGEKRASTV